jgi:hypothetical protein
MIIKYYCYCKNSYREKTKCLKVLLGSLFRQTALLTYYNMRQNLGFVTEVRGQQ